MFVRRAAKIGLALAASGAIACAGEAKPPESAQVSHANLSRSLEAIKCPLAVFVEGPGGAFGHASGQADGRTGRAMTVNTPVRIASNTKAFVAATILRLWEQKRLDLDAPIGPLLTPRLNDLLRADGYATEHITVRHLLSHSGGLADHTEDPRYFERILADPTHFWTREEQVEAGISWAKPVGEPGKKFSYSDTGYVLLGDIIERVTGDDLSQAVRTQLDFGRLGLSKSWWEILEEPPADAEPRARQYLGELDTTDLSGSLDLYGGGGLVMSMHDLAVLTKALFEGRVFQHPETLEEMLWLGRHEGAQDYRLGIMVDTINGQPIYGHRGFWGTAAWYSPAHRTVAAGVTLNKDCFADLLPIIQHAAAEAEPKAD